MARFFRLLTLERLVIVLTIAAVFVIAVRAPLDSDTLWHLRAGEWQVQHRALLQVDLFSHSRAGQPWINHSWLSQIILYACYVALGDVGLALYVGILAAAGMALVYLQMEGDPIVKAFVLVLATGVAAVFWSPRPQMMSFFLSAAVLYLLWLHSRRGVDRLWIIPPLMALWANLHGGFAIGFILMVLAALGEGAHWLLGRALPDASRNPDADPATHPTLKPALRIAVVGLVAAAAISFNPYGPSMLLYPFRTVGIGALRDYIQEWASPNFHQRYTWPFIWLLLGTLAAAGVSPKRLSWRDSVMVGGTAYSALLAGRNFPTFAIVAAPVLSGHTEAWLRARGYRLRWSRLPPSAGFVLLNWLLLIVILGAGIGKIVYALQPARIDAARRDTMPVEAVAYLQERHLPGPIFNSYNWGGYLIWTARDYPVYVDGRTDLYGDDLLGIYLSTALAQEGWEANLDAAGINSVLIERTSPLAGVLALSEGWERVYQDNLAVIFVREAARER